MLRPTPAKAPEKGALAAYTQLYDPTQHFAQDGGGGKATAALQLKKPKGGPEIMPGPGPEPEITPEPGPVPEIMPGPGPTDIGPETGPGPELSPAAKALVDQVEVALGIDRPETKKDGRKKVRKTTALAVITELGGKGPELVAEVVGELDRDKRMSDLLRFAGYKEIWQDEAAAGAVLNVLKARDPVKCRADIHVLTTIQKNIFGRIDLATNRWEARMAWEMLQVLPQAEREAILTGSDDAAAAEKVAAAKAHKAEVKAEMKWGPELREAKRNARKEIRQSKKEARRAAVGEARIERNMSQELEQSSRVDTYGGNAEKTTEKPDEDKLAADRATALEKDDKANLHELPDPMTELIELDPEPAKKTPELIKTTEDTDRQSLIATAIAPELWTTATEAHFQGVMRMVVQADEAATVSGLVKSHWATRGSILGRLGFTEDGKWKEVIKDETASTWFERSIAATVAMSQAVSVVFGLPKLRFKGGIDLQTLCKGFPLLSGLRLEESKRPTDPMSILSYVFGGAANLEMVLGWCGVPDAAALMEILNHVDHAGKWLFQRLKEADAILEGVDELNAILGLGDPTKGNKKGNKTAKKGKNGEDLPAKEEAEPANMLVVESNKSKGDTKISIPQIAIAAVHSRSGTTLTKSGSASIMGVELAFKQRNPFDQKRSISVGVSSIMINDLMITSPEGMTVIQRVELCGLSFNLESPETNPSVWIEKLRHFATTLASTVAEVVKFNATLGVPLKIASMVAQTANTALQALAAIDDTSKINATLGGLEIDGLATSAGDHIDEIGIGHSQVDIADERGIGFHLGRQSKAEKIEAKRERKLESTQGNLEKTKEKQSVNDWELETNKNAKGNKTTAAGRVIREVRSELQTEKIARLEAREERRQGRLDKSRTDLATSDNVAEGERDHVPAKLLKERKRANNEIARTERKIIKAKASGKTERADKLVERKAQAERVKERTEHTIADEVEMNTLDRQLAVMQGELARAKEDDDKTKIEALNQEIANTSVKRNLVQTRRLSIDAELGAIDVKGVDYAGVKADAIHIGKTTATLEHGKSDGGDPTLVLKNEGIKIEGLELAGDRRRDVALKLEIEGLQAQLAKTPPSDKVAREPLEKRLATLNQEQRFLEPVVREYEILRTHVRELNEEDRARFLELRKQLECAPTLKAKSLEMTNITMNMTVDANGKEKHAGSTTVMVGHIGAEGVESKDDARGVMGGDLSVRSASVDNIALTASSDLEALLTQSGAGNAGGGAAVEKLKVEDIHIDGARDEATARVDDNGKAAIALEAQLASIRGRTPQTPSDKERALAIEAQIANLRTESASLTVEHIDKRARMAELQAILETRAAGLTVMKKGPKGKDPVAIDLSRGASLSSLAVELAKARQDVDDNIGAEGAIQKRLGEYASGIEALDKEVAEIEFVRRPQYSWDDGPSKLDAQQKIATDAAIAERKAIRARAVDAQKAEMKKLTELRSVRATLQAKVDENARLHAAYSGIVELAQTSGLSAIAEANELKLVDISAAQMIQLAKVAQTEGDSTHVDLIELENFGIHAASREGAPDSDKVTGGTQGNLHIAGVKQGDRTVVKDMRVAGLGGGISYDPKAKAVKLTHFGVDGLSLSSIAWDSGTMSVHAPEKVALDNLRLNATLSLQPGAKNVIDHIDIDQVSAGQLSFRYGDYLLGTKAGGSLAMKCVRLSGVDLSTYNFNMDAESVSAEQLTMDLTRGMEISAKSLKTGLSVKGLVADGKYDVDLSDLNAADFDVKMAEMGTDVRIEKIAGGGGKISADVTNGVYNFDLGLNALKLGSIRYADGGIDFNAHAGMDLTTVKAKGSARMDDAGTQILVDEVSAAHAILPVVTVRMGEGKDAQVYSIRGGSLDNLKVAGLDLDAMTMDVTFENGKLAGLGAKMDGLTLGGGLDVKTFQYKVFKDEKGEPVTDLNFTNLNAHGNVKMPADEKGAKGKEGDPKATTKADGTEVDFGVKNANGKLRLEGDTTFFNQISVREVGLPHIRWAGGGMVVEGKGIAAQGIRADGHMRNYEKQVRGMSLPTSDLVITRLHVDAVHGRELTYNDGTTVMNAPKGATKNQLTLENLDIVGLRQIDGVMEAGKIELARASMDASVAMGNLKLGGGLEAEGLFCNFDHGKVDYGATRITLAGVHGEKPLGSSRLEFDAPRVTTTVVEGSSLSKYIEKGQNGEVTSKNDIWVESLVVLDDATAKYYVAKAGDDFKNGRTDEQLIAERKKSNEEKSAHELEQDLRRNDNIQSLRPGLAAMINAASGDLILGVEMTADGTTIVKGMPRIRINNGVLDVQTLLDSLGTTEIYGYKIVPTDLTITQEVEGMGLAVKVTLSKTLIAKLGALSMAASPFLGGVGIAAGAWLSREYGLPGIYVGAPVGGVVGAAAGVTAFLGGMFVTCASPFWPELWRKKTVYTSDRRDLVLPADFTPGTPNQVALVVALSELADPADIEKIQKLRLLDPSTEEGARLLAGSRDKIAKIVLEAIDALVKIERELAEEVAILRKANDLRRRATKNPKGKEYPEPAKRDGPIADIERQSDDLRETLMLNGEMYLGVQLQQLREQIALGRNVLRSFGVDVGAADPENFEIEVGPMTGALEIGGKEQPEQFNINGTSLSMGRIRLEFNQQQGDGTFASQLLLENISMTKEDRGTKTTASIGSGTAGVGGGVLDSYGFVKIVGQEATNPLEGKIKAGTNLRDLRVGIDTHANAAVLLPKKDK